MVFSLTSFLPGLYVGFLIVDVTSLFPDIRSLCSRVASFSIRFATLDVAEVTSSDIVINSSIVSA